MAPGAEPLKHRILNAIATTISGIAEGADYYTDVASAYVLEGNTLEGIGFPTAIIVHDGATETDEQLYVINVEMRVEIGLYIGGMDNNWRRDLLRYEADVAKALRTDPTLGGLVGDLHVETSHVFARERDGSVAAAQVGVSVLYRHPTLDPTTSQ